MADVHQFGLIPVDAVLQGADIRKTICRFNDKLNLIAAGSSSRTQYRQVQGRQGAISKGQVIADRTWAVSRQGQRDWVGISERWHIKCVQRSGVWQERTACAAVAPGSTCRSTANGACQMHDTIHTGRLIGSGIGRLDVSNKNIERTGIGATVAIRVGISDGIGRARSSIVSRACYARSGEGTARRCGAQGRQIQRKGGDAHRLVAGTSHYRQRIYRNIEGAGIGAAVAVGIGINDGIGRARSSVVTRARNACSRERTARRHGAQGRQVQRQFVFAHRLIAGASHRRLRIYRNIERAGIGATVAVRVGISDGIGRARSSVVTRARNACSRERTARRHGAQGRQVQRQFVFAHRLIAGASHRRQGVYRQNDRVARRPTNTGRIVCCQGEGNVSGKVERGRVNSVQGIGIRRERTACSAVIPGSQRCAATNAA
ncbi:MAG: hypothetical protein EPGJADBJ_04422 [Saprospiraceae bacterium]|nr:hypothetical protein [Saprospiraceae bacterium]